MNIFLIIPYNSDFQDVNEAVRLAANNLDVNVIRINEIEGTISITEQIIRTIQRADAIIADISESNSNVMYELGLARSFGKPVILICRKGDPIPFDMAPFQILIYDRIRLQETLIKPLRNLLAHKNPVSFIQKNNIEIKKKREEAKTVFVSYSHEDTQYLNRLKVHMRPFEKKGHIDLWVDTKITAGEKWKEKIKHALDKSVIAILLST